MTTPVTSPSSLQNPESMAVHSISWQHAGHKISQDVNGRSFTLFYSAIIASSCYTIQFANSFLSPLSLQKKPQRSWTTPYFFIFCKYKWKYSINYRICPILVSICSDHLYSGIAFIAFLVCLGSLLCWKKFLVNQMSSSWHCIVDQTFDNSFLHSLFSQALTTWMKYSPQASWQFLHCTLQMIVGTHCSAFLIFSGYNDDDLHQNF